MATDKEKERKVAFTNQRTGITTYREPTLSDQTSAQSAPADTTQTSAPAAQSPTANFFAPSAPAAPQYPTAPAPMGYEDWLAQLPAQNDEWGNPVNPGTMWGMQLGPGRDPAYQDYLRNASSPYGSFSNPYSSLDALSPDSYYSAGTPFYGMGGNTLGVHYSRERFRGADHNWYGLNPATGGYEQLYEGFYKTPNPSFGMSGEGVGGDTSSPDALQSVYFLASQHPEGLNPATWQDKKHSLFDQVMQIGIPLALSIISGGVAAPAGAFAAGAAAGGTGGFIGSGGDLRGALKGAALGGATAGILDKGGMLPKISQATGLSPSVVRPAANAAINYAKTGDVKTSLTNAAIGAGANLAAPYVNDFFGEPKGMLPLEPTASQVPGAAPDVFGNTGAPTDLYGNNVTGSVVGPGFTGTLESAINASGQGKDAPMTEAEIQRNEATAKILTTGTKALQALAARHGGSAPAGAPQRQEGQSDAQYADSLVQYAQSTGGFQSDALKGLSPGTPEYYNAVMAQMDSVIANLSKGLDLNAEDLQSQFRGHSQKELDDLERALYVRGQLGQVMGSGDYLDPFTGDKQTIDTLGQRVNPGLAAYHQGLAGSASRLAGEDYNTAYGDLTGMLGRTPDIFGMQAQENARRMAEIYAAQGIDPRKLRGGMLPGADLNSLSPEELSALLAG